MSSLTWPGLHSPLIVQCSSSGRVSLSLTLVIVNTAVTYCSYCICSQSTCRALSPSFSFSEDEKWSERVGWREETWLLASRTLSGSILNTLTVSKLWIVRVIRIILI